MECFARAHDVVAEDTDGLSVLDGLLQTLDCQRILCTNIDIALGRLAGNCGDYHAFYHPVGVALHDGAIHKCAGVTLIAVADDVLYGRFLVCCDLRPLLAGGEARAAAASQAGLGDHIDDLVGGHVEYGLFKSRVAADGDILLDALCVNVTAMLKSNTGLLLVEGDILLAVVGSAVVVVNESVDDIVV